MLNKVYPVGSYYWSESCIPPDKIFGGKWQKIQGKFLFSSDDNYPVGKTGGEEFHKLTVAEMPQHSHECKKLIYHQTKDIGSGRSYINVLANKLGDSNWIYTSHTGNKGDGNPHNNMPPYIVANCWKRIK